MGITCASCHLTPERKIRGPYNVSGPHEMSIRAGEERILPWTPQLKPGEYTVKARLIYDLNRYNARSFTGDQTETNSSTLIITVAKKE